MYTTNTRQNSPFRYGILPCILPPRRTPGRRGGGEGVRRRPAAPPNQNLKARPGPRGRGRVHQARPQHACGSTRITDRPELQCITQMHLPWILRRGSVGHRYLRRPLAFAPRTQSTTVVTAAVARARRIAAADPSTTTPSM